MTNIEKEARAKAREERKANAKHSKSFYMAVVQAIAITVLVSMAIGFVVGKNYANHQNSVIQSQAKNLSSSLR